MTLQWGPAERTFADHELVPAIQSGLDVSRFTYPNGSDTGIEVLTPRVGMGNETEQIFMDAFKAYTQNRNARIDESLSAIVILDLSGVTEFTRDQFGPIMALHSRLARATGALGVVLSEGGDVSRIAGRMSLHLALDIFPNIDTAVDAATSQGLGGFPKSVTAGRNIAIRQEHAA